jgi:transcription elongation factor GreA
VDIWAFSGTGPGLVEELDRDIVHRREGATGSRKGTGRIEARVRPEPAGHPIRPELDFDRVPGDVDLHLWHGARDEEHVVGVDPAVGALRRRRAIDGVPARLAQEERDRQVRSIDGQWELQCLARENTGRREDLDLGHHSPRSVATSIARSAARSSRPHVPVRGSGGTVPSVTAAPLGAPDLLRTTGLMVDGPVRWGAPLPSRKPGIYVVELSAPRAQAPLELTRVGKWLERLPALRLDGKRPTSRNLEARLASFWWPAATVLYAGASERSIGGRAAALAAHVAGDRQPHADGQWLHLLRSIEALGARLWWAETDAPEEYLDAVFDAFGAATGPALPGRPAVALALPWANLRRPTGERQAHGITGSVLPEEPRAPEPERRIVEIPPGDAEGARQEERNSGTSRRGPNAGAVPIVTTPRTPLRGARLPAGSTAGRTAAGRPTAASVRAAAARGLAPAPIELSQAALDRLTTELDELTRVKRPEVVARIKAAREHGDLKENAEYHAAREEQSFLEGRVQALEDRARRAVVIDQAAATGRVMLGSTVKVETGGDELTYTIVGTSDANIAAGRLSSASPVGAALLGATAGQDVNVQTPRGSIRYRVVSVE